MVAIGLGANNVPRNITQAWAWLDRWLPNGKKFHTLGKQYAGLYEKLGTKFALMAKISNILLLFSIMLAAL